MDIRNKHTGRVTARGTHTKFIPPIPDQPSDPKAKAQAAAGRPAAADHFISDMVAEAQEGFQPEATTCFETTALHGLTDVTASPGKVVCTLPIKHRVKNRHKTLHGGCTGEWHCHSLPAVLQCRQIKVDRAEQSEAVIAVCTML